MFHYRFAGPPSGPHYEQWREEFGRRWLAADIEPIASEYLANEFRATEHSFLGLCATRGTPVHMRRRDDIAGNALDFFYFIVASGSCLQTRQRGRSNELHVGQMTLMSAGEPAGVTQIMKGSRWSIRIPRKALNDFCRDFDDKVAQPITAGNELTKLLLHQIETAHRFGGKLGPAANHAMAQHILDLVALCMGAGRDAAHAAERRGLAAARLDSIKADIIRDIGLSGVRLERIAAQHRVSTRYVQHLFERSGTSFTGFVLEQRLRLASRLLRERSNQWRKVSDIALAVGFSDVSYFYRAFKARFGMTPGDVRADALAPYRSELPGATDDDDGPLLVPGVSLLPE